MKVYGVWAFRRRCETSHTSWSECLEKRESHVGQKRFEKAEREIP